MEKKEIDLNIKIIVTDCTVYNADRTKEYGIMSEKCLDPYINARRMDPVVVTRRARFS